MIRMKWSSRGVVSIFCLGSIDLKGIEDEVHWDELFSLPKDYWVEDIQETRKFLEVEVGEDLPAEIEKQLVEQEARIKLMQ